MGPRLGTWIWALLVALAAVSVMQLVLPSPPAPAPAWTQVLGSPGKTTDRETRGDVAREMAFVGTTLVTRRKDGLVVTWSLATGEATRLPGTLGGFATCPVPARVLTTGPDTTRETGLDGTALGERPGRGDRLALSKDCQRRALTDGDAARLVLHDGSQRHVHGTTLPARNSLAISANGEIVAVGTGTYSDTDGHLTAVETFRFTGTGFAPLANVSDPARHRGVWRMVLGGEPLTLFLGTQSDGQAGIAALDPRSGAERWAVEGFRSYWVRALALSPDGRVLVTGDGTGWLRAWDAATGEKLAERMARQVIQSLAFAPDGTRLAVGLWDSTIGVLDTATLLAPAD